MLEKSPPSLDHQAARQGESTGRMRMVLALSFIGAVVVLAALLLWWRDMGQSHLPAMVSAATALFTR